MERKGPRGANIDPTNRVPVHQLGKIQVGGVEYPLLRLGNWTSGRSYIPGNLVTSGGVDYVCVLANARVAGTPESYVDHAPPNATYWQVFDPTKNFLRADRIWSVPGAAPLAECATIASTSVAPGALTTLSWAHSTGSTLLDYTTPTAPKVLTPGVYAVSVDAQFGTVNAATAWFQLNLNAIQAATGSMRFTQTAITNAAFVGSVFDVSVSGTFLMDSAAGDNFQLTFGNHDSAAVNVAVLFLEIVKIL